MCTRNIMFYHFNLVFFLGYQMEGMNPRGFFINASFIYHPPFLHVQPYIICFDYEYLVQCSMVTTDHSCTRIFPICKLQFITFSPKLACFQKNCHSCKWQLTVYKQTLQTNFYVYPFCSTHIMISVCLFLFFSSGEKSLKGTMVF